MAKRDTSADLSTSAQGRRYLIRSLLHLDFADMYKSFLQQDRPAMMTVIKNDGNWDTSNVLYYNGAVRLYDKTKPTDDMDWIDYGVSVVKDRIINACQQLIDLADVYNNLSTNNMLSGYVAKKRFYQIGSPESLSKTSSYIIEHDYGLSIQNY